MASQELDDNLDRPRKKIEPEKTQTKLTLVEKLGQIDINNGGCAAVAFAIFLVLASTGGFGIYYSIKNNSAPPPAPTRPADKPNPVPNHQRVESNALPKADSTKTEEVQEKLYYVVWTDASGKDHHGTEASSKEIADSWVIHGNKNYPELKHRAVPATKIVKTGNSK